jgi:phosphoglycolate phosphatase-like HAD superfamily hydrolase
MQLAIFDIDGTLTQTTHIDGVCFVRAFAEELGITLSSTWTDYKFSTDSGITQQVFEDRFGRRPSDQELARLQRCFIGLLEEAFAQAPEAGAAVAGATAALARLRRHAGWELAIATGSWHASALLKLRAARLDVADLPAAFADDSVSRGDIIQTTIARAQQHYGQTGFDRVVYIGDGPWDVRTAARLRIPFLGVGRDRHAARLRSEGAAHIIEDFVDLDRFLCSLAAATVPHGANVDSDPHC